LVKTRELLAGDAVGVEQRVRLEALVGRLEIESAGQYPQLATMLVGESFVVPIGQMGQARQAAYNWKRTHPGWDYTTRPDAGVLRIWRTA
jgi:hypothetical protein